MNLSKHEGGSSMSGRRKFVFRIVGWVCLAKAWVLPWIALLGLALWGVGKIMSDRTSWSQWLSWIPTIATVLGMTMCVALSRVHAWAGRYFLTLGARSQMPAAPLGVKRRLTATWTRRAALVLVLIPATRLVVIEWRIPAGLSKPTPPAGSVPISVLYWNHAGNWSMSWMDTTSRELSDITVLNSPRYWEYMAQLMDKIAQDHGVRPAYQRIDSYAVISKWPIKRWARTDLNLPTIQTKLRPYASVYERGWYWNRGGACWIEFDSEKDLGRNLLVWIIDMPSDPRLWREELASVGGQTIANWEGTPMVRGPVGQFLSAKEKVKGFPTPDLVLGDFNIPRGARSLRHFQGQTRDIFDIVGVGPGETYPARVPLLGIDQMFAGPTVTPESYRLFHPGFGMHLVQQAVVAIHPSPKAAKAEPPAKTDSPAGVTSPSGG